MGLGHAQAKMISNSALQYLKDERTAKVCELGSQKVFGREISAAANISGLDQEAPARDLYESLGFEWYVIIDLDGADGALEFALNESLTQKYGFSEQFEVVTNFGTAEHVVDQRALFTNVHNLTATNGLMLHSLPSLGWRNHGCYRYDDVLVKDIAAANSYEIIYYTSANRYAPRILNGLAARDPSIIHWLALVLKQFRLARINTSIFCAFRKTSDEDFQVPVQGMYSYLKDKLH